MVCNGDTYANAEIFWNEDTNTGDLRALVEIQQGDEITICYTDNCKGLWTREEQRADLKSVYNFDCNCNGCDTTELKIQREAENIAAFKEEVAKKERVKT